MARWLDLSQPLAAHTPVYPGDEALTLCEGRSLEHDGYRAFLLHSGLHAGTHLDAPMHLIEDDRFIGDYPPALFTGPGVLLDVRGEETIRLKPEYSQVVQEGCVVLLYTGFDAHYGSERYFSAHPSLDSPLAHFFVERGIRMLGIDMPSPDHAPYTLHKALLQGGVFLLENLTGLARLTGVPRFEVYAFPLHLRAEASFVRAVCRIPGK